MRGARDLSVIMLAGLISLVLVCCSPRVARPPLAAGEDVDLIPEAIIQPIPLLGEIALRSAEISGLAWFNDALILLPQYPDRFANEAQGNLFWIPKTRILDYLSGRNAAPLRAERIILEAPGIATGVPGFGGFEAIAFAGDRAYLTIESENEGKMQGLIVSGQISPYLERLSLDPESLRPIPTRLNLPNMSEEAIVAFGDTLLTLHEVNGARVNPRPVAHLFSSDLQLLGTVPSPTLEYRLTDATEADSAGCFWVVNFFYPGERSLLRPAVDRECARYGEGASHRRGEAVERLVEFQLTPEGVVRTKRPPVQLQLIDDAHCRNWEGAVRLDDRGFLLMTDRYPGTELAFVPDRASGIDPAAPVLGTALSADGVAIRYEVAGQGELALIFVHGWSCDRSYWSGQLPYFARSHRVVAVDLAGHGDSGRERQVYTEELFGEDVKAVVQQLGLQRVVLIGHSMGGHVIVEAARRMPGRVAALICVDTLQDVERRYPQQVIDTFLAPLRADFVAGTRDFLLEYMFVAQTDSSLINMIVSDMTAAPPRIALSAMEELLAHDAAAAFDAVRVPVRGINSARNPINLEANRRHMFSYEVTVMEDVGHFLMMEKPELFNQHLDAYLREFVLARPDDDS